MPVCLVLIGIKPVVGRLGYCCCWACDEISYLTLIALDILTQKINNGHE